MDAELKEKWVEALKSGKYKQGYCSLYDENGDRHCCLGVAHKIITGANPGVIWKFGERPKELEFIDTIVGEGEDIHSILVSMNDKEGKTFHEIADWIEANL